MTTTLPTDLVKRPSSSADKTSANKRPCLSPRRTSSPPPKNAVPSISSIIHLPEDAVWSLRKSDLRSYFLALQAHVRDMHPYPLPPSSSQPSTPAIPSQPAHLPLLLRLPLEIRNQIYSACLSPPNDPPHRGPHPRPLQTYIQLTQSFPPALLRLNRQINSEALPILYGAPTQTVSINIDYLVWFHKTYRSDLILASAIASSIKNVHLDIYLGAEKRVNRPQASDAEARIVEVKKGVRKVKKWLAGAEVRSLVVGWREPANTFAWEVKKEVLDGLRGLRAERVEVGEVNWGLQWNKGRRYRFEVGYLKELERGWQGGGSSESLELGSGKS